MPGDEHETQAAAPAARTGPRHAAPRKPLLTRLHVPAGKAIALAAMPTAVLMGMGLTPQLAMAKPQPPESPFRNGPCVSAPDKAEQDAKDKAAKEKAAKEKAEKAEKDKAAKDKAEKEKAAEDKAAEDGSGKDQGSGTGNSGTDDTPAPGATSPSPGKNGTSPSPSPSAGKSTAPSPSATPSPSEQNPWYDPLGVGKKLHDVFHPGGSASGTPGTSPSPSPSSSAPSGKDSGSGSGGTSAKPGGKATDRLKDTAGKLGKAADDAEDKAGKALDDAKDKADDASPSATPSPSPSGSAGPDAPDADGRKPFPCVEEKKVAGKAEQPPTAVPNQPWYLESSGLTLRGLDYEGVVNLTMPNGRTKQALKFTADSIDIGDLHQIVDGPAGKKYHVQAAAGSTSTIRDGKVTMYTERLQGNLFGLIPIVFDPEHPPPLNVPFAYFTKVKITQAGQFGGTLTIPGLHHSVSD
ncbi:hypothetical protein OEIGOIKO_02513 [Streptomyces chrestomyceticus JCM 4735]|uniref:Hydrogenase expression protein HypF n=1 Tax=Streptomyces chrestomyceticus JCM 4735 TaxID=1306181 RepID=A0A7U9KSW6_9ACTN|nr:hypothetical protein [Streptomyces chrestomyceticus]GCD34774.1 hypothetical protein OEIGOIKO_02513 [Streptomyces chrestomyceticus JCM 4735]